VTRQEELLWDRWSRKREAPAFEALVAGHQAFVFDFARRVTGHDADAEDLAQEVFLELAEAPADRPREVGLRAFLGRRVVLGGRMLKRASLTRARHERGAAERRPQVTKPALSARPDAEAALALLDADDRHAIELRFLHDLPYEEIAHVLDIERPAARMRVHRALKSLRERLGEDAEACVAALVLFSPPSQFVKNTVRTASLVGGAIAVTSAKKKILLVLAIVAAGIGAFAWRSGRDARAVETRAPADRELARDPQSATERAEEPGPTIPGNAGRQPQPIPQGKGNIEGRVGFEDGTPLGSTKIELWGSPAVQTETDAEGRFRIHGDWVGNRDLCIVAENGFYFPIAHVEMKPDALVRVDINLDPGHVLEGVVVDAATRNPVAGAAIRLERPGARGAGVAQGSWGQADTDAQGRFRFRHVPRGRYFVTSDFPGLEFAFVEFDLPGPAPQILMRPARELRVRFEHLPPAWQGAQVTIAIHSARGRPFSTYQTRRIDGHGEVRIDAPPPGHYVITRLNGDTPLPHFEKELFIEADEPPLLVLELPAGARVEGSLSPAGPKNVTAWLQPHDLRARVDQKGRFVFPFVPEGEGFLHVILGRATLFVDRFEVPASGALVRDVRLAGVTLRGRLVAEGDDWSKGVLLRRAGTYDDVARINVDVHGRFLIPFVPPGEYDVFGWADLTMHATRRIRVGSEDLVLGDVVVEPELKVPVVVVAPEGTKLAGKHYVHIEYEGGSTTGHIYLDEKGTGHMIGLRPGRCTVSFSVEGFQDKELVLEVSAKNPATVRIELK